MSPPPPLSQMCSKEIIPPRGLREDLRYTDKKVWQFQSGTLVIGRQLIQGEMGKTDLKLVRIN